jgi:hypothetical protein
MTFSLFVRSLNRQARLTEMLGRLDREAAARRGFDRVLLDGASEDNA